MVSISKLTIHVLTCLALAAASYNATAATPTPLPPAAEEALNKGIIAAKVPDYLLAIRYFEEARKLASQAPVVYLNLGLAESRIPGRELRAMAWFGAYLAAYPDAPNAAAVKEQIGVLEVRNQSNTSRLIQTLQDSPYKDFQAVAKLWADSGDIATALKTASLAGEVYGGSAQGYIAAVQAKAGDTAGALKTAGIVVRPDYRSDAFLGIAAIQIERGDLSSAETSIALARSAADQIPGGQTKWGKLQAIAKLQIEAGKMDAAQATLRTALTAVDLIVIPAESERKDVYLLARVQGQASIASSQIEAGDIAGAKQSLALAFKNSELVGDPYERSRDQGGNIFDYYIKAGDTGNAIRTLKAYQKSVDLITDANRKRLFTTSDDRRHEKLAYAQVKAGDINGALKTVNEIVGDKTSALRDIISAQVKAGDYRGAVKTNGEVRDDDKRSYNLYEIAKAQAQARDFDGAAKNAELIQIVKYKEWATNAIAGERAKTNNPVVPTPAPTPESTAAKRSPVPSMTAEDWIKMLDDKSQYGAALNTEPFLNLAGYLKSLPPSDNPHRVFDSLHKAAETLVKAQNMIAAMLKQQARK
ncbi:hypothetical protein [Polaromonas sp.]|uniref:hypothetical protein n=1 Tax=Polaromonas sp. TaxID=1869339 RepID=UPI002FC6FBD3